MPEFKKRVAPLDKQEEFESRRFVSCLHEGMSTWSVVKCAFYFFMVLCRPECITP